MLRDMRKKENLYLLAPTIIPGSETLLSTRRREYHQRGYFTMGKNEGGFHQGGFPVGGGGLVIGGHRILSAVHRLKALLLVLVFAVPKCQLLQFPSFNSHAVFLNMSCLCKVRVTTCLGPCGKTFHRALPQASPVGMATQQMVNFCQSAGPLHLISVTRTADFQTSGATKT